MPGRSLGVAWWLYRDEAHNGGGRHISYLKQPDLWRHFDPDLFDSLAAVVGRGRRCVQALQDTSMLTNAAYCDEVIPTFGTPADRRASRLAWFGRVRAQLSDCDLVFADPDNGLETAGFSPGALVGGKCIALSEVAALGAPGRALIIYHHQTRYTLAQINEYLHANEVPPCPKTEHTVPAQSPATGSHNGPTAKCGVELGSTPIQDRLAEHRSALRIFQSPNVNLPVGSREMSARNELILKTSRSPECLPATMKIMEGTPSAVAPKE